MTNPQPSRCLDNVPRQVAAFHDATAAWHAMPRPALDADDKPMLLHSANFELWHLEDLARDPHATDAILAQVKRSIDGVNQRRNDLVEQIDTEMLQHFAACNLPNAAAPLHSETPGMMLDRLSILALKIFHTAEQAARTDASPAHRGRNEQRLHILRQQSADLAACLAQLLNDVTHGRRSYRLYKQLKMYNDPDLNPVLYTALAQRQATADA